MIDDVRPNKPKQSHRIPLRSMVDDSQKPTEAQPSNTDTGFQTPEEIAAHDTAAVNDPADPKASLGQATDQPKDQGRWTTLLEWRPNRKQWIIIVVVGLLLIGGGVFALTGHKTPAPVAKTVIAPPLKVAPVPTTVASRLTGVQVAPALANLPVTGVMIENSDAARPQSGLSQAGVVFEALAEGGVTRFLALYEEGQPASIGPIRSARPYYIDWLLPFDAGYAHVGGSPTALSEITSLNVKDLNEFYNGNSYNRISSRQAPHNVYTSMANLTTLEKSKGWTSSNFTGFPRKTDSPVKTPTVTTIGLNLSYADMNASYQYDPAFNSYKRSEGGSPMTDANTNQQLEPKVVIAMVVPWTTGPLDATGAYYTDYSDIGTGPAYVFQDGTLIQGVWLKSSPSSQIQFNTTTGVGIKLNAGQTWITAVGTASEVTFK